MLYSQVDFMEIIVVLVLIVLNGLFAMTEMAIVSSRKSKLQEMANKGSENAKIALELATSPNKLLSTSQIGITFIGIFAGAFGGERLADKLAPLLEKIPTVGVMVAEYSHGLSLFFVVTTITFASLIIGELVPKRIALNNPEMIAKMLAAPMQALSKIASPLVAILSFSTDSILRVLGISENDEPDISEEEVKLMIREGARAGVFNLSEKNIVERTFRLSDKKVAKLMTPISEVVWLNAKTPLEELRKTIEDTPHSHFPICKGGLDSIIGVVRTKDLLANFFVDKKVNLKKIMHKPLYVPENTEALKVLELFKKSGIHMAIVVDEYGSVQGVLSLTDILEEIVGEIATVDEVDEQPIKKRADGSWLIDGLVSIDDFKEYFKIAKITGESTGDFHTIGGFVMKKLDRVPATGDMFEWRTYRFEVVDMDGNRVDKVLVSKIKKQSA